MGELFNHTLFFFRFEPKREQILGCLFWGGINTAIRLGTVYICIRVVCTALDHGSF